MVKNEVSPGHPQSHEDGKWHRDREVEIKFKIDAAKLQDISSSQLLKPVTFQTHKLKTVYYDTGSNDLHKGGIILRVRKKGRAGPVLAVKSVNAKSDSPFARNEIEVRSNTMIPQLWLLDHETESRLKNLLGDQPLEPKFEMFFKRRTAHIDSGNSQIEIAVDTGFITAGSQQVPVSELEVELKSGDEADLYDFAIKLAQEHRLQLDFVSKADKGFQAIARELAAGIKAEPILFETEATLDDAVTVITSNTLAQFVANWAPMLESDKPDPVHQMRVSLRRMRSAIAMFNRSMPCAEFNHLRNEAKRIATALGPARECDAFRLAVEQGPLLHPDCPASCQALLGAIEERRIDAYKDVRTLVESPETTLFVLQVQSFLARRVWRKLESTSDRQQPTALAKVFAREALDKLNKRVRKRGKGLPEISDNARHELRIALKNLRYGAEFFGELFDRPQLRHLYIKRISKLQDLLGAHNDTVAARIFLRQFKKQPIPDVENTSGFILGWYAREAAIASKDIQKLWKKFKKTDFFWS